MLRIYSYFFCSIVMLLANLYAMEQQPRSLDQYFGLTNGGRVLPRDVKNLVVQHILGDAGWWYQKTVIDTGGFSRKLVFHPQKSLFVTLCKNTANIWDFEGTKKATLKHADTVNDVAFHPHNATVITVSDDGNALLWGVTGKEIHRFPHVEPLKSVLWNARGNFFVTVVTDKVYVWQEREHIRTLRAGNIQGTAAFHPQENTLAILLGSFLWLRNLDTGEEKLLAHKMPATAVAFHPNGTHVAITEAHTHQGIVWNLKDGSHVELPHANSMCRIVFHPTDNLVATSSCDYTACLWSLEGVKQCTLPHKDIVGSICFSPQGNLMATGSHDGTACVWDRNGIKKMTFSYDKWVMHTAFNADGSLFAVMTLDGCVRLYQKHAQPTLAQLLMRRVLKNYFQECIAKQEVPELCAAQEEVPFWMAQKFNLEENELRATWHSMPEALRKSIFCTLCFRVKQINQVCSKKGANDDVTQVDYV